jgi:hypothetical protein
MSHESWQRAVSVITGPCRICVWLWLALVRLLCATKSCGTSLEGCSGRILVLGVNVRADHLRVAWYGLTGTRPGCQIHGYRLAWSITDGYFS